MALQILKNPSLLPNMEEKYDHYASVEVKRNTGLRRLLGIGVGSVSISTTGDPAYPIIQLIPPVWQQGEKDEWELLQRCYEQALQLAWKHHCDAVTIPLLTADDPQFPAYIDYKIAVDTIRKFLEFHSIDVFLVASRQSAFQMPELRKDVERFLSRNFFGENLYWSSQPFTDYGSRFNTIAPAAMEYGFSGGEYQASAQPCEACPSFYEAPEPIRECRQSASKSSAPLPPRSAAKSRRDTGVLPSRADLDPMLLTIDAGFSETLLNLIDKTGKKDSDIYNKANVSRQHFSKIRNNPDYKPSKPTAIAFAIALELDMMQTLDLIGRAGYTLTNSSKFDVIIMYFIQNRNYNMFDINDTLYEYDQNLLGA